MSKYIDADKLIALIDAKLEDLGLSGSVWVGRSVLQDLKEDIITSLQQEQHPGIEEPGVPGKDFIPVEWVDACEKYGKWKIVQQEVDLEKEIQEYIQKLGFGYGGWVDGLSDEDLKNIARYFFELGLKVRKEK